MIDSAFHVPAALAVEHHEMDPSAPARRRTVVHPVQLQFPRATLEQFARRLAQGDSAADAPSETRGDRVAMHLAHALLPALEQPEAYDRRFVDQMLMALQTHLLQLRIDLRPPQKACGLARWQEQRAKERLAARASLDGAVDSSIADAAAACRLSRGHFSKAFKQTTGRSPQRWLQEFRIDKAKGLLMQDLPIADVSAACGFADQSHLTRVFAQIVGEPPSRWRRGRK